jgi:hypothetical protein
MTQRERLFNAIKKYRDNLMDLEDTEDGPNGPRPNWAMRSRLILDQLMRESGVYVESFSESIHTSDQKRT